MRILFTTPLGSINIYLFRAGVDFRGYLGLRAGLNVFGLLNWTVVRTFFTRVPWVPLTTFLCTFCAFWTERIGAFFTFSSPFFSAVFLGTGAFLGAAALAGAALAEKENNQCRFTKILNYPKHFDQAPAYLHQWHFVVL